MRMRHVIVAGTVAVVISIAAAVAIYGALYYGQRQDAPPLAGSVRNFAVAETPQAVPDVPVIAADGGKATLERYRGRLVLLNFWATWCGPCVHELPSLQALSKRLDADRAVVVLLSQDRGGFAQISPFLDKLQIDIADSDSYVDDKLGFSRATGVNSLPTTILIDAEGRIRGRLVGAADWSTPEARALIDHYLGG